MSTAYRRNPRLIPEWDAEAAGKVALVDSRSGRMFRVEPAVLGLLNRMADFVPVERLSLDGHPGPALVALLDRMAGAGLVEAREDGPPGAAPPDRAAGLVRPRSETRPTEVGDSRVRDGQLADLFADRGEWTACELAMHAQSSRGGKPHLQLADIPPARLTHPEALRSVALPSEQPTSHPLAQVLEARRSIRDYRPGPLPLPLLAAFLDRATRVRGWLGSASWQTTRRPSASGGGRHSLEVYLVVREVDGLAAGGYHYDPFDHSLHQLDTWSDQHDELQRRLLCGPMAVERPPPVSLYLASYYRRVQCKYGGMTLSLIYRDTGCLLQTCYLTATDLGLAGCATAAMEAEPSPGFLRGRRDAVVHTGNFALGLPADTEPHDPEIRPLLR